MISRNSLPKYSKGHAITHEDLNKLRAETQRMGRIKGSAPIQVQSDATGITIGLAGNFSNTIGFASLLEQINPNGSGKGQPYTVNNPPDGNYQLQTANNQQIKLYAPPTLNSNQYYASGSVVTYFYNANWKRYVIISSPYCSC